MIPTLLEDLDEECPMSYSGLTRWLAQEPKPATVGTVFKCAIEAGEQARVAAACYMGRNPQTAPAAHPSPLSCPNLS